MSDFRSSLHSEVRWWPGRIVRNLYMTGFVIGGACGLTGVWFVHVGGVLVGLTITATMIVTVPAVFLWMHRHDG